MKFVNFFKEMSTTRKVTVICGLLGIVNLIAGKFGYHIPDAQIDSLAEIICYAATFLGGLAIDSNELKNLLKGKQQ